MRCFVCQKLGHTKAWCNSSPICGKCGDTDPHPEECSKLYCVNCNSNNHSSSSKDCPSFRKEKEILRIMNRQKCSKFEARKQYFASTQEVSAIITANKVSKRLEKPNSLTFAQVASSFADNTNNKKPTNPTQQTKPTPAISILKTNYKVLSKDTATISNTKNTTLQTTPNSPLPIAEPTSKSNNLSNINKINQPSNQPTPVTPPFKIISEVSKNDLEHLHPDSKTLVDNFVLGQYTSFLNTNLTFPVYLDTFQKIPLPFKTRMENSTNLDDEMEVTSGS